MDNLENTNIIENDDINVSASSVNSYESGAEGTEVKSNTKKDGFKFIFKEVPRLVIFIVSIAVSLAFFICAGVFSGESTRNSDNPWKSYRDMGTITAASSISIPTYEDVVICEFVPTYNGYYTFTTYTVNNSNNYSYNNYYSAYQTNYDTVGVLYNSKRKEIARDDDSGTSMNFSITEYLRAGETYYIAVRNNSSYNSYSSSNSSNLYLRVSEA